MYLMYVDESGDTGLVKPMGASRTRYFCLTGLVVHESHWTETLNELLRFRHRLKHNYGMYLDDELHHAALINKPSSLRGPSRLLKKHERLAIIRQHADQLSRLRHVRLINICVDKQLGKDANADNVLRRAWYALFQRFENTIERRNFPGPVGEYNHGIVFPDMSNASALRQHLNDMRMRNKLSIRNKDGNRDTFDQPIRLLIEDPVCRDSRDSYFIQAADCAAYLFKQHIDPSAYVKKMGAGAYFKLRLKPILCTHASNSDPLGVVRL